MAPSRQMDKENVVYFYSGIFLHYEKKKKENEIMKFEVKWIETTKIFPR